MPEHDFCHVPPDFFDAAFYARSYPDVPTGIGEGYAHYRAFGMAEGRRPNLWFDPHWYRTHVRACSAEAADFLHFLTIGARSGLSPSPALQLLSWPVGDTAAMLDACMAIDASLRALAVKLSDPLVQCLAGLFLPAYYKRQAGLPDATADAACLSHFVATGLQSGLSCSPLFDAEWYLAEIRRTRLPAPAARTAPLLHWLQHGRQAGLIPSPVFDPVFYLADNPDVGGNDADAFAHFLAHGLLEERRPNARFDPYAVHRSSAELGLPSLLVALLRTTPHP